MVAPKGMSIPTKTVRSGHHNIQVQAPRQGDSHGWVFPKHIILDIRIGCERLSGDDDDQIETVNILSSKRQVLQVCGKIAHANT